MVTVPEKVPPNIRAFGLREQSTPKQIEDSLRDNNRHIFDENSVVKVVYTFSNRSKDPLYGFKLETDPVSFQRIIAERCLMVLWEQCSVSECLEIRRCYNCCGFYHISTNCSSKTWCVTCGGDHKSSECESTVSLCINCKLSNDKSDAKVDTNHKASSIDCMVYKRQIEMQRRRVYGSI